MHSSRTLSLEHGSARDLLNLPEAIGSAPDGKRTARADGSVLDRVGWGEEQELAEIARLWVMLTRKNRRSSN